MKLYYARLIEPCTLPGGKWVGGHMGFRTPEDRDRIVRQINDFYGYENARAVA